MKTALISLLGLAAGLPLARAGGLDLRADYPAFQTVTFLGVETSPVSPTLTAQLGLPEDTGLVVEQVAPESPAAASIMPFDVLLKLDDQWLIDQRQFAVLVRNHKTGDEVTLTYVRAGKQSTSRVKLARHQVPKIASSEAGPFPFELMPPEFGAAATPPGFNDAAGFGRSEADRMFKLMDKMDVDPANSSLLYSDDQGTLNLTIKDGKQSLVAQDPRGKEIFSGPVDTPEQRKALPAEVGTRLDKLESMSGVSFSTDGNFKTERRVKSDVD